MRLLGVALLLYGAVGLGAALYSYTLVHDAFQNARSLVNIQEEKRRALSSLQAISVILQDAATASTNMNSSFESSQVSLQTASTVASDVAVNLRLIAQLVGVQIFGAQPMVALAQPFEQSSERLDDLATDLAQTSSAISANANDMRRLSADFSRLKTEVDGLSRTVERLPADPTGGVEFARLEIALSAMLFWIGLQGLAALFTGLAMLMLPGRR
jgi:hypothetical protein